MVSRVDCDFWAPVRDAIDSQAVVTKEGALVAFEHHDGNMWSIRCGVVDTILEDHHLISVADWNMEPSYEKLKKEQELLVQEIVSLEKEVNGADGTTDEKNRLLRMVTSAQVSIAKIEDAHFHEVVRYSSPPKIVLHVVQIVLDVLGSALPAQTWPEMQAVLRQPGFLRRVATFDSSTIPSWQMTWLIRRYNAEDWATSEVVAFKASQAVGPLLVWSNAQLQLIKHEFGSRNGGDTSPTKGTTADSAQRGTCLARLNAAKKRLSHLNKEEAKIKSKASRIILRSAVIDVLTSSEDLLGEAVLLSSNLFRPELLRHAHHRLQHAHGTDGSPYPSITPNDELREQLRVVSSDLVRTRQGLEASIATNRELVGQRSDNEVQVRQLVHELELVRREKDTIKAERSTENSADNSENIASLQRNAEVLQSQLLASREDLMNAEAEIKQLKSLLDVEYAHRETLDKLSSSQRHDVSALTSRGGILRGGSVELAGKDQSSNGMVEEGVNRAADVESELSKVLLESAAFSKSHEAERKHLQEMAQRAADDARTTMEHHAAEVKALRKDIQLLEQRNEFLSQELRDSGTAARPCDAYTEPSDPSDSTSREADMVQQRHLPGGTTDRIPPLTTTHHTCSFEGEDWDIVLRERGAELHAAFISSVAGCCRANPLHIDNLCFSTGSLHVGFDAQHPDTISSTEIDNKLRSFEFVALHDLYNHHVAQKRLLGTSQNKAASLDKQVKSLESTKGDLEKDGASSAAEVQALGRELATVRCQLPAETEKGKDIATMLRGERSQCENAEAQAVDVRTDVRGGSASGGDFPERKDLLARLQELESAVEELRVENAMERQKAASIAQRSEADLREILEKADRLHMEREGLVAEVADLKEANNLLRVNIPDVQARLRSAQEGKEAEERDREDATIAMTNVSSQRPERFQSSGVPASDLRGNVVPGDDEGCEGDTEDVELLEITGKCEVCFQLIECIERKKGEIKKKSESVKSLKIQCSLLNEQLQALWELTET